MFSDGRVGEKEDVRKLTGFSFLIHQRDRHHNIIRDGEAHLKIRVERDLHSQENVGKDSNQLRVSSGLQKNWSPQEVEDRKYQHTGIK